MKLWNTPITSLFANASLTTRFAVNSFICIGIMTAALWFIVSNYLINQIVEREWQTRSKIGGPQICCSPRAHETVARYCPLQSLQSQGNRHLVGRQATGG